MKKGLINAALLTLLLLGSLFVRPNLTEHNNDAFLYITAADCYLHQGLSCSHDREPVFPLFLATLKGLGISLPIFLPLIQNLIFLFALWFLIAAWRGGPAQASLRPALVVALLPTFLISMNGAAYTESISASLVCVMLGAFLRLCSAEKTPPSRASWAWLGLAFCAAALAGQPYQGILSLCALRPGSGPFGLTAAAPFSAAKTAGSSRLRAPGCRHRHQTALGMAYGR